MKKTFKSEKCPICGNGQWVPRSNGVHCFKHKNKTHRVIGMHDAVCSNCGTRGFLEGQIEENKRLIAEYERSLRDFISPDDIYAIREKYLLSQAVADKIFCSGKNMFSKWERGESVPAGTAAATLRLALRKEEFMKMLADDAGESIECCVENETKPKEVDEWAKRLVRGVVVVASETSFKNKVYRLKEWIMPPSPYDATCYIDGYDDCGSFEDKILESTLATCTRISANSRRHCHG